ncbi:hypothetical protein ACMYR3_16900 (plasmid) [Ampullimonas aquatilis]|uniref:hypothetical protein n=1 Tax=Ampullimonas aquatilis TaxID=1341549 RepID=UPI003C72B040
MKHSVTKKLLTALSFVIATTSCNAVIIGVNGHPRAGLDPNGFTNAINQIGFGHVRIDTGSPTTMANINAFSANKTPITAVVYNNAAYAIKTGSRGCEGTSQALEDQAYKETYDRVMSFGGKVQEIELENEVSLYNGIRNGGKAPYKDPNLYKTACGYTMASILRGMSRAVADVASHTGVQIKRVLGATGAGDVGFIKFMQEQGVQFDVLGYHNYPSNTQPSMARDPWYGPGGTIAMLNEFGKPIEINEFNCGEVYQNGYDNRQGSQSTQNCAAAIKKNLTDLINSGANITYIDMYEMTDETFACAGHNAFSGKAADAECRFGMMYDLNHPKTDIIAALKPFLNKNAPTVLNLPPVANVSNQGQTSSNTGSTNYGSGNNQTGSVGGNNTPVSVPAIPPKLTPAQATGGGYEWGCEVLLCLANPAGPMAAAACVPPILRLYDLLDNFGDMPSCTLVGPNGQPSNSSYARQESSFYDACPAGLTALPEGELAVQANQLPTDFYTNQVLPGNATQINQSQLENYLNQNAENAPVTTISGKKDATKTTISLIAKGIGEGDTVVPTSDGTPMPDKICVGKKTGNLNLYGVGSSDSPDWTMNNQVASSSNSSGNGTSGSSTAGGAGTASSSGNTTTGDVSTPAPSYTGNDASNFNNNTTFSTSAIGTYDQVQRVAATNSNHLINVYIDNKLFNQVRW